MRSELLPLLYGELRRRASQYLRKERRNHTLPADSARPRSMDEAAEGQACRVTGQDPRTCSRGSGDAARAHRSRTTPKTRQAWRRTCHVTIDDVFKGSTRDTPVEDLLTLETAIGRLEAIDPRAAQVVVLRFYSGLSTPEVALHLGVSVRTVEGDWAPANLAQTRAGGITYLTGDCGPSTIPSRQQMEEAPLMESQWVWHSGWLLVKPAQTERLRSAARLLR
jgi:DNA-directed RNA polymerase specialized sigma24 family protein